MPNPNINAGLPLALMLLCILPLIFGGIGYWFGRGGRIRKFKPGSLTSSRPWRNKKAQE